MSLRIVNWNLEWAPPRRSRGQELRRRIEQAKPEVVCLTESHLDFLPGGHVILADANYGYRCAPTRRKVLLWSRRPWTKVDELGDSKLPSGRYIRGTTETSVGPVTFVGVCVPWKDAHVRTGRRDRDAWEDHAAYLEQLPKILKPLRRNRTVVLGDFNQTIPRTRVPEHLFEMLTKALIGFEVATAGRIKGAETQAIDHVYYSAGLRTPQAHALSNICPSGKRLSDHFGLSVMLANGKT